MPFSPTADNCNRFYKQDIDSRTSTVRHFLQLLYMKHVLWHWHTFPDQYARDQRKLRISVANHYSFKTVLITGSKKHETVSLFARRKA